MYYPTLQPEAQTQLKKIGQAELVIGLASYKNPDIAAEVARIALAGVHQYYPHLRTVLINADAGYHPTTRQAVRAQAANNGHNSLVISSRYEGALGQGNATAALLDAALALDAKAVVILDADTPSLTPAWVAGLAQLVLDHRADLVLPRYRQWLQPAGAFSDLLVYPLVRALWGHNVRHPAAPDFAIAPQLAAALLDEDIWGTAAAAAGLPPWLTSYAVVNGWRVAQTALSEKCLADGYLEQWQHPNAVRTTELLQESFHDIMSVLFSLMRHYRHCWQSEPSIQSLPTLTRFAAPGGHAAAIDIPPADMLDRLALGWMEYRPLWAKILTPDNLAQVQSLAVLPPDQFYFPSDLWAKVIYDFAVVFCLGEVDPAQVVEALFPLYQGRLAAFGQEIAGLALVGREGTVAAQTVEFEELRPYLAQRWNSYRSRFFKPGIDDRPII